MALTMVMPPSEAITNAVEVAPLAASATTWKRLRLEREDVAETVRIAKGDEVPNPVLETPAA